MNIKKTKADVICCECEKLKESYKISYSDGNTMTYLCENCLDVFTKKLNDNSADRWMEKETSC